MQNVDIVNVAGTELPLVDLDDGSLLAMARTGHQQAYATLFSRYAYAAHRLARHLGQKEDSDDVVSEAFAQVLDLLGRGKGPDRAFRAYLFTTIRHECARRAKARQRVMPTDDLRQIDTPVAFGNGELDGFERSAIRAAYESLPERWQTVLWHLDVEGRKPHELGPLLGLTANSVSALVYRARAGLREAYLQQHVKAEHPDDSRLCAEHRAKLSSFVRRTASARDQERIHAHLESCSDCMAIYLDLQEVNREVGLISAPVATAAVIGVSVASFGAHVTVLIKGVVAVFLPSAAAAAIASATLVAVPHQVAPEPQRHSMAIGSSDVRPVDTILPPSADAATAQGGVTATGHASTVSRMSVASNLSAEAVPSASIRSAPAATQAEAPRPSAQGAAQPPALAAARPGDPQVIPALTPAAPIAQIQAAPPASLADLSSARLSATVGPLTVKVGGEGSTTGSTTR